MASMLLSVGPWITSSMRVPHSSSTLTTSKPTSLSFNCSSSNTRSSSLHSSFLSSPSSISFNSSSFSGLSLGLNLTPPPNNLGGRRLLVVTAAGRSALCLTKRSRSRKSLARTHGFRKRMSTTNGIAVLKRRRAKGRKVLCTKTHSNSGK